MMECSCCYGVEDLIDPGCGHFIHEDCVKKLVNHICPICSKELSISHEIAEKIKENKLHLQEEIDEDDRVDLINIQEDVICLIGKIRKRTTMEVLEFIKLMTDYFGTLRYLPTHITVNYSNTNYIGEGVIYNSLMKHSLDLMIKDIKNGNDQDLNDDDKPFDIENERLKNLSRCVNVNFDF